MEKKSSSGSSPAVMRIDKILTFLASQSEGSSLSTICKTLGLPRSSASRLVDGLAAHDYITLLESRKVYVLGSKISVLSTAMQKQLDLGSIAAPFMWNVCRALDETVKLNIVHESQTLVKSVAESERDFRIHVSEGTITPLYCGAANKILLTFAPQETQQMVFAMKKEQFTPTTLIKQEQLVLAMDKIRKVGFGFDNREYVDGVCAVGVPVFSANDTVSSALSIAFIDTPANQAKNKERIELLMEAAREISKKMGGVYPYTLNREIEHDIDYFRNIG